MSLGRSERWGAALAAFDDIDAMDEATRETALAGLAPEIADTVRAMLESGRRAGILDGPLAGLLDPAAAAPASLAEGDRIGSFIIEGLIGRGGMGEVYRARRDDPSFDQRVALKLLRIDHAVNETLFNRERRTLARLDHPLIAHFIDGGVTREGRPWMAMAYVEGEPLGDWARRTRPSLDERLRVFRDVCEAVAHAHASLVIHRDLKPSNILVDVAGRVRLLDFGVATLLDDSDGRSTTGPMMTLDYAAPEQLTGEPVTAATDVHALGVVLHELLTGRTPWSAGGGRMATLVRRIVEEDVAAPSRRIDPEHGGVVAHRLRGDLDAIVLKALRKAPADRYGSVRELADDIDRHLSFRPVTARAASTRYRVGRWVVRNRWPAAAAAAIVATLAGGVVATRHQAERAEAQRDVELAEAARSDSIVRTLTLMMAQTGSSGDLTLRQTLDRTARRLLETLDRSERSGTTVVSISELYINLQDAASAGAFLDEALARGIGADSAMATARIKQNLANTELFANRHERVETLLAEAEAALDPADRSGDAVREDIIGTRASLARRRGDTATAIALISDLDRAEAAFAGNASAMLSRYNNLLVYLIESNRFDETTPVFDHAARLKVEADVGDSIQAIGIDQLRGSVLFRTDRAEEAERVLLDVADRRRRLYGETPGLASDLSVLARVQTALGKRDEARAAALEARPLAARYIGETALPTILIDLTLAQLAAEDGDPIEARRLLAGTAPTIAALPPINPVRPQRDLVEAIAELAEGDAVGARAALARAREGFVAIGPAGAFGLKGADAVERRIASAR